MVDMGVGEQYPRRFKGETSGGGDDFSCIGTGVDDQQEFFSFKKDETAICGNGADRESFDGKHYFFLSSRMTCLNAGVLSIRFNLKSRWYSVGESVSKGNSKLKLNLTVCSSK